MLNNYVLRVLNQSIILNDNHLTDFFLLNFNYNEL